ncbi:MAG: 2-keto-4-pentenoate hydratase/2-oxohepta-3-ene-1,7-dioic acid hydratase in catechol pathway [Gammaproteobacteria bacterium]|jgi:2-keto-4-pentenoate hydratase/2-oxohepta-3-ene-1,7-dioic acid hydratase in catechol pathway
MSEWHHGEEPNMRWARYEVDGHVIFGLVEGDELEDVTGDPFAGYERTGRKRPLGSVPLLVPLEPRTFYAAGLNYVEHIKEQAASRGEEPNFPPDADIGYRANNALIAHGQAIVIPQDATERMEYEAEIVVVIGKQAKHLTEANALSCVLGYTIGNDVSERAWQKGDRTMWRAKNSDTFKPMGPWIETELDLDAARTTVRLNGKQTIDFATNNMLFNIPYYLARMTRYLTLHPGDMVWMGTEGKSPQIKHGDDLEIEISGIGVLQNPIVREGS